MRSCLPMCQGSTLPMISLLNSLQMLVQSALFVTWMTADIMHFSIARENHAVKGKYQECIKWARKQPEAVSHFGLCPWNNSFLLKRLRSVVHDIPFFLPLEVDHMLCIFTDGSAFFVDQWDFDSFIRCLFCHGRR